MVPEYDEKGKFFTEVISKDQILSHIQTTTYHIRGYVHVCRGERISDELNQPNIFLPVTDAEISSPEGEILYTNDFMLINRDHIVWLMPVEEHPEKPEQPEE